jgi:cell division protein FtsA
MSKIQTTYLAYVGTSKVAFLKAESKVSEFIEVKALSARLAIGFSCGMVHDLTQASETLTDAIQDVTGKVDREVLPCRLVVASPHLKTYTFQSSVYFHGNAHPITLRDIRQTIAQTRSVATIPLDEMIVQVVPQEFLVNDMAGVQNPLGLDASRLGVTLRLLTMNFLDYSNLLKVAERCELDVTDVVPGVLASANAVLSAEERQSGVMLVNIGGRATHFACIKNSVLVATRSLALGGDCITEVIEKKLNMDHLDAQKVKEAFGSAVPKAEYEDELIPVRDSAEKHKYHVKRKEFDGHLKTGLERFFGEIQKEVEALRTEFSPLNQLVFTGGAVKLDGFLEQMKELTGANARIGTPNQCRGPEGVIENPAFSSALGGIGFSTRIQEDGALVSQKQHWLTRGIESLRNWVFEYL